MLLNGGPTFKFSPGHLAVRQLRDPGRGGRLLEKLSAGGKEIQCGWLVDKFGVSWQSSRPLLIELLGDKDPGEVRAGHAGDAEDGEARHQGPAAGRGGLRDWERARAAMRSASWSSTTTSTLPWTLGQLLGLLGHDVMLAHDGPSALATLPGGAARARVHRHRTARQGTGTGWRPRCGPPVWTGRRWSPSPGTAAMKTWRRSGDRDGFDYHLVKPVDMAALQRVTIHISAAPRARKRKPPPGCRRSVAM